MSINTVYCIEYFKAKPGGKQQLHEALKVLVEPSRAEEGCIQYDLLQDEKDDHLFILVLQYESKAAMEEHDKKPYVLHFSEKQMERLCDQFYWHDARAI